MILLIYYLKKNMMKIMSNEKLRKTYLFYTVLNIIVNVLVLMVKDLILICIKCHLNYF